MQYVPGQLRFGQATPSLLVGTDQAIALSQHKGQAAVAFFAVSTLTWFRVGAGLNVVGQSLSAAARRNRYLVLARLHARGEGRKRHKVGGRNEVQQMM